MLKSLFFNLAFIWSHPLNRYDRIGGVSRFVRWQLAMRLVRSPILFRWINDTKVFVSPGETGISQNVYCGLHEHLEMSFVLHVLGPDDLFVDIGANVGSYTLLACGAKKARGIAIEPVPATFSKLQANIAVNGLQRSVQLFQCGIGARIGDLTFSASENCTNHVLAAEERGRSDCIQVPVRLLDDLLMNQAPTLLKVDVEGYELPVIEGAHKVLEQTSLLAVIMELKGHGSRYGFDEGIILHTMKDYGFHAATYDPFKREMLMLDGPCVASGNTIFVRNPDQIMERIMNAPRITINKMEI